MLEIDDECLNYDDECPRYDDECSNSITTNVVSICWKLYNLKESNNSKTSNLNDLNIILPKLWRSLANKYNRFKMSILSYKYY